MHIGIHLIYIKRIKNGFPLDNVYTYRHLSPLHAVIPKEVIGSLFEVLDANGDVSRSLWFVFVFGWWVLDGLFFFLMCFFMGGEGVGRG